MIKHKRANNRALAFALDMIAVLKKKRGLDWQIGTAECGTRECVDVIGWKNGNQRVLVEVELRRKAPLANVVKVWKQLTDPKNRLLFKGGKPLVMFQAFSAFYQKKGTQRGNARFVAREMEKVCPIKYIQLSMNYRPGKGGAGKPVVIGGGRRTYHAKNLARRILTQLSKMEFKA